MPGLGSWLALACPKQKQPIYSPSVVTVLAGIKLSVMQRTTNRHMWQRYGCGQRDFSWMKTIFQKPCPIKKTISKKWSQSSNHACLRNTLWYCKKLNIIYVHIHHEVSNGSPPTAWLGGLPLKNLSFKNMSFLTPLLNKTSKHQNKHEHHHLWVKNTYQKQSLTLPQNHVETWKTWTPSLFGEKHQKTTFALPKNHLKTWTLGEMLCPSQWPNPPQTETHWLYPLKIS